MISTKLAYPVPISSHTHVQTVLRNGIFFVHFCCPLFFLCCKLQRKQLYIFYEGIAVRFIIVAVKDLPKFCTFSSISFFSVNKTSLQVFRLFIHVVSNLASLQAHAFDNSTTRGFPCDTYMCSTFSLNENFVTFAHALTSYFFLLLFPSFPTKNS